MTIFCFKLNFKRVKYDKKFNGSNDHIVLKLETVWLSLGLAVVIYLKSCNFYHGQALFLPNIVANTVIFFVHNYFKFILIRCYQMAFILQIQRSNGGNNSVA